MAGDATTWKAMSHPLRQQILRQLGRGPATSTTIAAALGENTGTTSYHLRVLADAGLIEEIRDRGSGRERWWRAVSVDLRSNPDDDSLSAEDRAALERWRAALAPGEIQLLRRLLDEWEQHGRWAGVSRASGYYTAKELDALREDYIALLNKYRHSAEDAPPGARLMHLRMFFLPDEDSPGDR
jgi:DNA-binding transcriptional ArsR family regulator